MECSSIPEPIPTNDSLAIAMMASNPLSQTTIGQPKRTSFSGFPVGGASIFLDRSKATIRGATPDSDALASSDDEPDHLPRLRPVTSNPGAKPIRRASWLPDSQPTSTLKNPSGVNGPFSPASPSSVIGSSEQSYRAGSNGHSTGSKVGRVHSNSASFPWGNPIWNSEVQKGPPQRLTEVLPSPTTIVPPGTVGSYNEEPLRSPALSQDNMLESAIPFAIPLQPTLKTYRSQSYSVGQLEPETLSRPTNNHSGYSAYGRPRNGSSYAGLQHRPPRPSMLGELNHDPSLLGQVREVDDDGESSNGSEAGAQLSTQARTIEKLAMENAMLRAAAADQIDRETRDRHRAPPSTTTKASRSTSQAYLQRPKGVVPEESDFALYEADDSDVPGLLRYGGLNGRRSSEYGTNSNTQYLNPGAPENRNVESVKKGQWQSSLGFGGLGEAPQSRRHSFADVPTRQNSISSAGDSPTVHNSTDASLRSIGRHGSPGRYGDASTRPTQGDGSEYYPFHSMYPRSTQRMEEQSLELEHLRNRDFAVAYFSREPSLHPAENQSSALPATSMHQAYMQSQYGRPQQLGNTHSRPNQLLYMVTFKAQRADVFYVQEGTGLQVRKGELVIVEADRGADLGTVASESIPFAEAKELRDKYMQEHYTWLMVFSRHGQNGTMAGPNPNSSTNTAGGLGPGHNGAQELPSSDLKPKMIKRLAQAHEIQSLRDKEGNEAKAKRVCQQKVIEHRLNMEILEAEFQM